MHMSRAEYRIQNTESGRSNIHTFCGILYAPARSRMHAGPSNIQFPRLLEDSVCSGKIQNARRTVQHTVSTPFGGFCMLRPLPRPIRPSRLLQAAARPRRAAADGPVSSASRSGVHAARGACGRWHVRTCAVSLISDRTFTRMFTDRVYTPYLRITMQFWVGFVWNKLPRCRAIRPE